MNLTDELNHAKEFVKELDFKKDVSVFCYNKALLNNMNNSSKGVHVGL
jgi:hypothetical protein